LIRAYGFAALIAENLWLSVTLLVRRLRLAGIAFPQGKRQAADVFKTQFDSSS
jgi:hypothetical protein